jgi:hypothetical protein
MTWTWTAAAKLAALFLALLTLACAEALWSHAVSSALAGAACFHMATAARAPVATQAARQLQPVSGTPRPLHHAPSAARLPLATVQAVGAGPTR